jgi:rhodanese-related sulfurtransferase/DNA-binding transcriptional ArsR family regulator
MSLYPSAPDDDFKEFVYEQFSRLGKALASPQRLIILNIISQGEHTVEVLARYSGLSVANVSRHLQILKATNLVKVRKDGKYVYYRLADDSAADFFIRFRDFACTRLPEIVHILDKIANSPTRSNQIAMRDLLPKIHDQAVFIIDVRPEEEYRESHLPGAVSMPLNEIKNNIETLPKDKEIIVYCRGEFCILADQALEILKQHGYEARRMNEGLIDWKIAGFPIQS